MELYGCYFFFILNTTKNNSSRGRIWQPCSMMYWHVRTAYGGRRKKSREKPKLEIFRNILKIGSSLVSKLFPLLAENHQLLPAHFRSFLMEIINFSTKVSHLSGEIVNLCSFSMQWKQTHFLMSPSQIQMLLCQSSSTNVWRNTVSPVPWFLFTQNSICSLE